MLRLDHVVFPVRSASATLHFYRTTLGLPLVETISGPDWGGHAWVMMIFGLSGAQEIACVELLGASAPDYSGLPKDVRHYALAAMSETDLRAWRARLLAAGVDFWEEVHGERLSLYFSDPDGIILEITWPPSQPREHENPAALASVQDWIAAAGVDKPTPRL